MVDQITEVKETSNIGVAEIDNLDIAVTGLKRDSKKFLAERGEIGLDELLDRVYDWENLYGEKLTDDEFEVLSLLSLIVGTTKVVYEKQVGKRSIPREALLNSVKTQQEVIKMVFANLDDNGKPSNSLMRSFGFVGEIYGDYFNPETGKMKEEGVYTQSGYWQGVQGMVTSSLLFKDVGWKVELPPPELDLDYNIDLLVQNPEGKVFAVDTAAKKPHIIDKKGTLSDPFYVEKKKVPNYFPKDLVGKLEGFISMNVPPLDHHSSWRFYENRITGYPSETSVSNFRSSLEN